MYSQRPTQCAVCVLYVGTCKWRIYIVQGGLQRLENCSFRLLLHCCMPSVSISHSDLLVSVSSASLCANPNMPTFFPSYLYLLQTVFCEYYCFPSSTCALIYSLQSYFFVLVFLTWFWLLLQLRPDKQICKICVVIVLPTLVRVQVHVKERLGRSRVSENLWTLPA